MTDAWADFCYFYFVILFCFEEIECGLCVHFDINLEDWFVSGHKGHNVITVAKLY